MYPAKVLYSYPPIEPGSESNSDVLGLVADLCFPNGVGANLVEKRPSLSDINELLYGNTFEKEDSSFIFTMRGGDLSQQKVLYGVAIAENEMVRLGPSRMLDNFQFLRSERLGFDKRYVVAAPRCYCLISYMPFFELHFDIISTVLKIERVERLRMLMSDPMVGVGAVSTTSGKQAKKRMQQESKQQRKEQQRPTTQQVSERDEPASAGNSQNNADEHKQGNGNAASDTANEPVVGRITRTISTAVASLSAAVRSASGTANGGSASGSEPSSPTSTSGSEPGSPTSTSTQVTVFHRSELPSRNATAPEATNGKTHPPQPEASTTEATTTQEPKALQDPAPPSVVNVRDTRAASSGGGDGGSGGTNSPSSSGPSTPTWTLMRSSSARSSAERTKSRFENFGQRTFSFLLSNPISISTQSYSSAALRDRRASAVIADDASKPRSASANDIDGATRDRDSRNGSGLITQDDDVLTILHEYNSTPVPEPGYTATISFSAAPLELKFKRWRSPRDLSIPYRISDPNMMLSEASASAGAWAVCALARNMSLENMITMLSCVLLEKQVVVFCPTLGVLTGIVFSMMPLILPFVWQSVILPVMPSNMIDFLDAPVPFIAGIQHKTEVVREKSSDLIRVNVYKNKITYSKTAHRHADDNALANSRVQLLPRHEHLAATISSHYERLASRTRGPGPIFRITGQERKHAEAIIALVNRHLVGVCSNILHHSITHVNEKNERVSVLLKESFIGSFIDGEHHIGTNAAKGVSASSTFGGGVDANERQFMEMFVETQMFNAYCDAVFVQERNVT